MRQLSLWLASLFLLCALPTPSQANERKFIEPPGAYRYAASLPDAEPGFRLVSKSYVDDMDPAAEPGPPAHYLRLEATPGEYEPVSLVIYATRNLSQLDISVSDLKNESGVPIPASAIEVSRVVRSPVRDVYNGPPDQIEIVNRFLARSKPLDLPKSEFREIWLTLHVPEDAAPGAYAGEVKVRSGAIEGSLDLYVRVLPFKLAEPKDKSLGLYYADRHVMEENPQWLRRDLANMRAHGVRNVRTTLAIHYRREADGAIVPDTSQLETFLPIYSEMNFRTIIFWDNFNGSLANMTGHGDYVRMMRDEDTEPDALPRGFLGRALAKDPAYRAAVRRGVEAFAELQRKFPELDLYLQHMDEPFGHEPHLDLYCEITQIAREEMQDVGQFYITFHTTKEKYEDWRKTIAPYVDLRNYAGYPFEWWLSRGHTMEEKRQELAASGDKAWFYHNFIWRAWNPEWSRIINGLFLWVSPFEVHCPDNEVWIARPGRIGNPYDETTGRAACYAMFLPDPEDPDLLVPSLLWECAREGFDDVRYFATLESLIQEKSDRKPAEAAKAKQFLARLRAVVEEARRGKPRPDDETLRRPGEIDLETPLLYDRPRGDEIGGRSPLIRALAMRFTGRDWHTIRSRVIEHILALMD